MEKIVLKEEKLIDFLINNFDYSNKKIKKLLTDGNVLVDNQVIKKYDYILKNNQKVKINIYNRSKLFTIIYEDKDIIVVDKPCNMLTIKDNTGEISLYNLVSEYVKSKNKLAKIFIVHRLDKETSGIVLFAKNEYVKNKFQDNWNDIAIERKYMAIVTGKAKDKDTLKSFLKENQNHFVYSANTGKLAITEYNKIKEDNEYTYLDIKIQTGRKNQIRVQLKDNNTPILGDKKYGGKSYNRLCLHAYRLVIINPINNKKMIFESVIPF